MEVADHVAIISHGRLEQVGTPAECYDHPVNEFVLRFLGPATMHNGEWVRPHDLELSRSPSDQSAPATVERILHLGFEIRVEVRFADGATAFVQIARRPFEALGLVVGDEVHVTDTAPDLRIPAGSAPVGTTSSPHLPD
jgi:sulfate transport system ATP-binding protein